MDLIITDDIILNRILLIRGYKDMLDRYLALLFDLKPTRLREQVSRNNDKFPANFMFRLTDIEAEILVSQNAIPSKQSLGGFLPLVLQRRKLQLAAVFYGEKQ